MTDYLRRSWAEIDLDALTYNVKAIRALLKPGCMMLGVVKADAYGHGAEQVAKKLVECGVNWFGVSNIEEGEALRKAGFTQPVLIFGTTPAELAPQLAAAGLTQSLYSPDYAQALSQAAQQSGVKVSCHVKLDTGMTRLGFMCDDENIGNTLEDVVTASRLSGLSVVGAFTHFASADDCDEDSKNYTHMQFARFTFAVNALKARGVALELCHCANSAATIDYPEMHMDMVRPGIILYGIQPSVTCGAGLKLMPVMSLRSSVASVKNVPAGTQISYGRTFIAKNDMTVAVVPIGYADGYSRAFSGKACMLVNGCRAPVLGRVCMDQLMLDVTGIKDVKRGDDVTVFGCQGGSEITVDSLAKLADTIPYEITCQISKRIPRVYLQNGKPIEVVGYII
ncbi:MAG: alanine racemase [Hydrogenoanaerobacterium sp.]